MDYMKLFAAVSAEYGEDIAIRVSVLAGINFSLKVTPSELSNPKKREHRIKSIAKRLFGELPRAEVELVIALWQVSYDWEVGQTLGGQHVKSFEELMSDLAQVEEWESANDWPTYP